MTQLNSMAIYTTLWRSNYSNWRLTEGEALGGNYEGNSSYHRHYFCKQKHMLKMLSPRIHGFKNGTWQICNVFLFTIESDDGNLSYLRSSPPVRRCDMKTQLLHIQSPSFIHAIPVWESIIDTVSSMAEGVQCTRSVAEVYTELTRGECATWKPSYSTYTVQASCNLCFPKGYCRKQEFYSCCKAYCRT